MDASVLFFSLAVLICYKHRAKSPVLLALCYKQCAISTVYSAMSNVLLVLCYKHCAIRTVRFALCYVSGNLQCFVENCNMSRITQFVCYFFGPKFASVLFITLFPSLVSNSTWCVKHRINFTRWSGAYGPVFPRARRAGLRLGPRKVRGPRRKLT